MGKQKKFYDNPKDATRDLFSIGGIGIVNKALQTGKDKAEKWIEVVPGGSQVLQASQKLKAKGFFADIDPLEQKAMFGWKKKLGGKD